MESIHLLPTLRPVAPLDDVFPAETGTYALSLMLTQPLSISIGRLGVFLMLPSRYVYIGSARGPGGLRARILRHFRKNKPLRWHIDYLTSHVEPEAVCFSVTAQRLECDWVRCLSRLPGAKPPIPHFGSSDCTSGCVAHLLRLQDADGDIVGHTLDSLGEPVSIWRRGGPS